MISSEGSCPEKFEDWHPNSIYCYLFKTGDDMKSWDDAKTFCKDAGGNLASEHTKQERNYIVDKLKAMENQAHTWIGLRGPEDQGKKMIVFQSFITVSSNFYYTIIHLAVFIILMFIYLDDRKDPKNWKWTDDSSMSYKDWDEGEPSANGRCGYMRPENSYTWDDCGCDLKQAFLCKIMKGVIV